MDKKLLNAVAGLQRDAAVNIELNGEVDLFQCNGQLVLNGFFGNLQYLRSFLVPEAIFLNEPEGDFAAGGEIINDPPDTLPHFFCDHQLFGVLMTAIEGNAFINIAGGLPFFFG